MKKFLYFLTAFFIFPAVCFAASQKLGVIGDMSVRSIKGPIGKELDLCKDMNCPAKTPCTVEDGKAVCRCTETSCGEGAQCVNGSCKNCTKGTQCNCPSGKLADGKGACEAPNYCSPNPCRGTTPLCTQNSRIPGGYACGCSSSSCGAGYRCSVPCDAVRQVCVTDPSSAQVLIYNCTFCEDGATDCNCPSGQVADGKGGCRANCTVGQTDCPMCEDGQVYDGTKCRMPCDGVICPSGYQCQNGDGTACCTTKCYRGQLNCPECLSGQLYDGTKCRYPCDGVICPAGKTCVNGNGKGCCVTATDTTEEQNIDKLDKINNVDCSCEPGYSDMTGKSCPAGQTKMPGRSCVDGPQCAKCVAKTSSGGGGGGGGSTRPQNFQSSRNLEMTR